MVVDVRISDLIVRTLSSDAYGHRRARGAAHRQVVVEGHRRHPGQLTKLRHDAIVKRTLLLERVVRRPPQLDPKRQRVRRVEPAIDESEAPDALEHQAGAGDEDHGECDLAHDEQRPQPLVLDAFGRSSRALLERGVRQLQGGTHCGHEPGDQCRQHRDTQEKSRHGHVHLDLHPRRKLDGDQPRQHRHAGERQHRSHDRPAKGEDDALTQERANDAPSARSERRAHGHLAIARDRARQQEVRHVGARHGQDQRHGAEQQQHVRPDLTGVHFAKRRDAKA